MPQEALLIGHIYLILFSELHASGVLLRTDKSDVVDFAWHSGILPVFSNVSKIIQKIKQVTFNSLHAPEKFSPKKLKTIAKLLS